jgi:ribosomal protein S18 acetylase RimI-like enzyme
MHLAATAMTSTRLAFRTIDLGLHAAVCVTFRRDSFVCSFGVDNFFVEAGPDGRDYLDRLEPRIAKFPDGYVHLWLDDKIIGQMEMQIRDEPRIGYVNLFYLVEEMRGVGLGSELQDYAMQFCARRDRQTAQLSMSPTNARAVAYYRKHGWRDLGPRPGHEHVHLMQRDVPDVL